MTPEQKEVRRRWVAALRSGKYKQGRRALRDKEGRYCCLGVLCDLVDPGGWTVGEEDLSQHGEATALPTKGISVAAGLLLTEMNKLVQMNDGIGATFEEIALFIEANTPP